MKVPCLDRLPTLPPIEVEPYLPFQGINRIPNLTWNDYRNAVSYRMDSEYDSLVDDMSRKFQEHVRKEAARCTLDLLRGAETDVIARLQQELDKVYPGKYRITAEPITTSAISTAPVAKTTIGSTVGLGSSNPCDCQGCREARNLTVKLGERPSAPVSAPVAAAASGANCSRCNTRNEYADAVGSNGRPYVCYGCRSGW